VAAETEHGDRTTVERRDPLLGAVFDRRFLIESKIASGGFGAIYRATHLKLDQEFALKLLHANLIADPHAVARFQREGAALTRLRDPHTITAYDTGETPDGRLYIVMELLRGESLYDRFRTQGPLPWRRVLVIARAVCSSLAEAHAHGIIHRDLKPTNIHLEPRAGQDDFVKVLDFGIAKILQDSDSDIDSAELTQAGHMIGTLDYMSPEQMVGGMCTATSDIYTLGIVMYEMICGRKPFDDAATPADALAAVLTTIPERLASRVFVLPEVDRVVMRCLERQHADRFQSAQELSAALDDILSEDDVTSVAAERIEEPPTAPVCSPGSLRRAAVAPIPVLPPPRLPRPPTLPPPRRSSSPRLAPSRTGCSVPEPDATPAGRSSEPRLVAPRLRSSAPLIIPPRSLRDAYPTIHLHPPSPMRPMPAMPALDDRPSGIGFEVSHTARQQAMIRRVSFVLAVTIAVAAAIVVTAWL
jgi:serine/threonine-protein kinase